MDETIYTHENWNNFLAAYFPGMNKAQAYEILAVKIGVAASSITNQCAPAKDLPTWARAFIFAHLNFPGVETFKKKIVSDFAAFVDQQ